MNGIRSTVTKKNQCKTNDKSFANFFVFSIKLSNMPTKLHYLKILLIKLHIVYF